jgi:photosystem II stability/assembly factor-like uncharacterized protein
MYSRYGALRVAAALGLLTIAASAIGQAGVGVGVGVWSTHGPEGGNVYCIVPDPSDPSTLYAGTPLGVFKSADGGASWRASAAGMPAARVQTIAVDPTATSTLYAGTLTPNGVPSLGLFKSTDGGASWAPINNGLIDPVTASAPLDVAALAIDPRNSSTLLAGTRFSEVFQSIDGGMTWQPKTSGGFDLALQVSAFQFDPSDPAKVYAASTQGLLRSTDGGESWDFYGDAGIPFFTLAIDPTTPSTIYAGDATGFGILKSTDSGNHWVQMNASLPMNQDAAGSFWPLVTALAVDPSHTSTVYAATYGNGLFQSTNGAVSWASADTGLRISYIGAIAIEPGQSATLHVGTFGAGIYQSVDAARTWTSSSGGLDLGLVTALVLDAAAPGTIYASTFDGVHKSSDGGARWQPVSNGLPVAPVAALALVPGGTASLLAGTFGGGLFKSSDGGATWSASAQGLNDLYVSSVVVDPSTPSTLYAGTDHPDRGSPERVFKSTDGGATWTQTTLNASVYTIDFLAVNPGDPSQVVAGSQGVTAYFQSRDAGKTWATVKPSASCGGVNAFLFDPSGSTLYIAGTAGACRTTDNGTTWAASSVGSYSIRSLAIDPLNAAILYAGTALDIVTNTAGVFRSTDRGQTWELLGSGFPPTTVAALVIDDSETVRAGTRGSGVAGLAIVENRPPIQPPPSTGRRTTQLAPR